jgi:CheY-like chemotaxis protein
MKADSKKILIIDDNDTLLEMLSQLLARLEYEIICAHNGYNGLSLFTKRQCDIVLTDYDMPGMDGITLAHHIKSISPDTLVILMTGHDRASIMEQIEKSKVDLALFKPFDFLQLMHILQEQQIQNEEKLLQGLSV